MPVATTNDFLEALRKSGLLEPESLDAALASYPGSLDDTTKLAEHLIDQKLITKFQAKSLANGRYRGLIIGPYKILDRLGAGGMGIVYLAQHMKLDRRVAIKVLPEDKTKDKLSLERFYREARAVAALDHPNIVKAFDVAEHEGLHYFVMEYIDGANLQRYLDTKGPLQWKTALNVAIQACKGLQQAHERGLVHRDIKPANILVDKSGMVKILDLGLARTFDQGKDNLTQDLSDGKEVMGSIDYIAPEQAIANKPVDIRADIYSLGATLYALITGRPPVDGTTAQKLLQHQVQMPTPVHKLKPDVPEGVSTVLAKMMAKKPDHRYSTPNEVITAMTPFVSATTGPLFPQLAQTQFGQAPLYGPPTGNLLSPTGPVPTAPLLREVGQTPQSGPIESRRDTTRIKKTKKFKKKRAQKSNTTMIVVCTMAIVIPIVCLVFFFVGRSGKEESGAGTNNATTTPPVNRAAENTPPGNTAAAPAPANPNPNPASPPAPRRNPTPGKIDNTPRGSGVPSGRPATPPATPPAATKPQPRTTPGTTGGQPGPNDPRGTRPPGVGATPPNAGAPSNPGGTMAVPPPPADSTAAAPPPPVGSGATPPTSKSEGNSNDPKSDGSRPSFNPRGGGSGSAGNSGATPPKDTAPPALGSPGSSADTVPPPTSGNAGLWPALGANFRIQEGRPMADIIGEDFENTNFRLSDYEGKVVLLDFWGFWCPHCVKMIPHEKELVEKYKNRPFALLGVNNDKTKAEIDRGMKQYQVPWRNFKDKLPDGSSLGRKLGVKAYPSLILIDHKGIVRKIWVGAPQGNELENTIARYLDRAERAEKAAGGGQP